MRAVWFDAGPGRRGRLLLTIHHLAVDAVSWRILRTDLAAAWRGEELSPEGTPFRAWARLLERESVSRSAELDLWRGVLGDPDPLPAARSTDRVGEMRHLTRTLPTSGLLTTVPAAFHAGPEDVLLAALATAFARLPGRPAPLLDIERHGREEFADGVDPTRTVGWFTSVVPPASICAGSTSATRRRSSRPSKSTCGPPPTTVSATACSATSTPRPARSSPNSPSRRSASTTWAAASPARTPPGRRRPRPCPARHSAPPTTRRSPSPTAWRSPLWPTPRAR